MPSLFNRRSRSVSTTRPVTPASSSAHAAAAQAYMANRQSQSNLSASAAAAALRSMSPAATPIDQIQTKRMLSRQTSNSSVGAAARGRSRTTVQRRTSNGSMTERTFRSPSPGRQTPSQLTTTSTPPPVPPLPQSFATEDIPPIPQRSHRRSMSLENFSTRVASPPPVRKQQVAHRNISASNMAALAATRSVNVRPVDELERSNSRNSYNFSYPRGSRPNSPPPQSPRIGNAPGFEKPMGAHADGISAMETKAIQDGIAKTAAQPVKKKKKKPGNETGQGTHLQNGSMNEPTEASQRVTSQIEPAREPTKSKTKKAKPALTGEQSHFPDNAEAQSESNTPDETQNRRAQRAAGTLAKQPSVVREDWEGEQDEAVQSIEEPSSPVLKDIPKPVSQKPARTVQSKKPTTEANVSRKIEDASRNTLPASVTTSPLSQPKRDLAPKDANSPNGRQSSTSPSRSFRFSDRIVSDLTAGRKHEPLPRAVSPAKSALKHHSPSRGGNSPTDGSFPQRRASSVTPSESSEVSIDIAARKKANRVSFEATPEVVGAATEPDINTPQSKDTSKRSWFAKSKKPSPLSKNSVEEDPEMGMLPRPVLPSFGSVRKNRQTEGSPSPASRNLNSTTLVSTASLSDTSTTAETPAGVSSDHSVGVLINQAGKTSGHPLPPKVTSVEGSGYASDSESLSSDDDEEVRRGADRSSDAPQESAVKKTAIPDISVHPATPGLDTDDMDGQWADANASATKDEMHITNPASDTVKPVSDEEAATDLSPDEHHLNTIAEESDSDSMYDDAPEDSSELENQEFGSINAIVGSPAVKSSSPAQSSSPIQEEVKRDSKDSQDLSWEQSRVYWSGVSNQLRSGTQSTEKHATVSEPTQKISSARSKASVIKPSLEPAAEIVSKPKLTKGALAASQLNTSVPPNRNINSTANQNTTRNSMIEKSTAAPALRQRPQSMANAPTSPKASSSKIVSKNPTNGPPSSKLQKQPADDSDSDSSFRRARPKKPNGSGFARRTMRGGPTPAERPSDRDLRSMSPVNRLPLSTSGPSRMRTSMRGSQAPAGPTLRGPPAEKRSSSLFSKTRTAKSPSRPLSTLGFGSRSQSRLADSDDEDGPRPYTYQSRYVDSSDDEEGQTLRPVRGIPKRKDEGDSTDLEDSSDDQRRKTKKITPRKKLEINIPAVASPTVSEPMSPTTAKKRGFWGRLRGSKDKESPNAKFTISERQKAPPNINGKEKKQPVESGEADTTNIAQLGFHSTAERDALVEQTMKRLEAARATGTASMDSSNKRIAPQRVLSDSWPLSPKLSEIPEDRPVTSAGAGEVIRPGMGERLPTSDTLRTAGGTAVYGRNGKKKRFPRLRRAFGLTD